MRDPGQLYFATNKEIYDILRSSEQKITEVVLHELLLDRGIFRSFEESRDALVQYLSLLTHDYGDVCGILERREPSKRGEKTTTVTLKAELTAEELKTIVEKYQRTEVQEVIKSHKKSETDFVMDVTYWDTNFSRTRLLQRQERDAEFVFTKVDGGTQVRFPASDTARTILDKIKGEVEATKKSTVQLVEIELSQLASADERTSFFTKLISSLPGFPLETVSRLRVAHASTALDGDDDDIDIESEEIVEVEESMLGVVENVALHGNNLVNSEMYQELKGMGYFITSITWRAKQKVLPFTLVEFYAGFEDGVAGKKFRYSIRGALFFKNGAYTKNLRSVGEDEKASLLSMIERTARTVLAELLAAKTSDAGNEQ
jgi:hypothetical protein